MRKIFFLLLLGAVFTTACSSDKKEDAIAVGDRLPDLSLVLSDGSTVNNETLTGKISVIMLFSATCVDCKNQFPVTEQFYRDYKDIEGFTMFGISRGQDESVVSPLWQEKGYTMPYSAQATRDVYHLFAASIVPRIYVSDRNRVVRALFLDDPLTSYATLKEIVDQLLAAE